MHLPTSIRTEKKKEKKENKTNKIAKNRALVVKIEVVVSLGRWRLGEQA